MNSDGIRHPDTVSAAGSESEEDSDDDTDERW